MQKAKQDAQEEWDAFLAKHVSLSTNGQIGDRSETSSCNCAFRIEDVQIQTPPEHPDFTIEFISSTECQPGNPRGSTYFQTMGIQLTGCGCEPEIARL